MSKRIQELAHRVTEFLAESAEPLCEAQLNENQILNNAKAIVRRAPVIDPIDDLSHEAVKVAERHLYHTGEMLHPHVAASVAMSSLGGLVNDGVADPRESARTKVRTAGSPEHAAMHASIEHSRSMAHLFNSHSRFEQGDRDKFHAAVREHLGNTPSLHMPTPTDREVEYAVQHAHDPKHAPMMAAAFVERRSSAGRDGSSSLRVAQTGHVRYGFVPAIGEDDADHAARVFEGIAKTKELTKHGVGMTPAREAAAKDILAHDPVMHAPKALAAWHRHQDTIESWAGDLPLKHQPHEMGQHPVAENDTHRVYRIDDAHQAGLRCWRPDGHNARYCLTAPGSGEHHLKRHYGGDYPIFIATRKSEAGEHLHAAYIPSMLHRHPTEAVRNSDNDGPLTGGAFDEIHPLLRKAHPGIDEVSHRYTYGGDIDRQHSR